MGAENVTPVKEYNLKIKSVDQLQSQKDIIISSCSETFLVLGHMVSPFKLFDQHRREPPLKVKWQIDNSFHTNNLTDKVSIESIKSRQRKEILQQEEQTDQELLPNQLQEQQFLSHRQSNSQGDKYTRMSGLEMVSVSSSSLPSSSSLVAPSSSSVTPITESTALSLHQNALQHLPFETQLTGSGGNIIDHNHHNNCSLSVSNNALSISSSGNSSSNSPGYPTSSLPSSSSQQHSSSNLQTNNIGKQEMYSSAEYLTQLLKDQKQIQAFPGCFFHLDRLLNEGLSLSCQVFV